LINTPIRIKRRGLKRTSDEQEYENQQEQTP
jgi:hypothetical protein